MGFRYLSSVAVQKSANELESTQALQAQEVQVLQILL